MSGGPSSATLVLVYFPHQLVPALAAVEHHRRGHGHDPDAPLTIVPHLPGGFDPERRRLAVESIRMLVSRFPGAAVWLPESPDFRTLFSPRLPVRTKAARIRALLGAGAFGQVFYPHDLQLDFAAQSLMQAYPRATRICFGDGLGIVYTLRYYRRMMFPPLLRLYDTTRQVIARAVGFLPRPLDAEIAALLLPVDPGGDFLPGKRLEVTPAAVARSVLERMAQAVPGFLRATESFLRQEPPHFVLPIGNLSEAGLCTDASEVELYERICERHAPGGAAILLKPHPGTTPARVDVIARRLASRHRVTVVDREFMFVPLEVARDLALRATVLSISSASVSLRHIHGAAVIHALDDELIDRFAMPAKRKWMKDGNDLHLALMRGLEHWNGNGPIA